MDRSRRQIALLTAAFALLQAAPATAGEPQLTPSKADLRAAFHCQAGARNASREPILLVTGTAVTGREFYIGMKPVLDRYRRRACWVDFPDYTTADYQVSAQYLVFAIRKAARLAGRQIAIYGISQGGLLPRIALTYWPSLGQKVTDVVAIAGPQHGTTVEWGCSESNPCAPALWQQHAGSDFLTALNRQPDESPGPTAWTTVRTRGDEFVKPQNGRHPTSALKGASNIVIQRVCPGKEEGHFGIAVDSVTWASLLDAVAHRGPAKASRLPASVCSRKYARPLEEQEVDDGLAALAPVVFDRLLNEVPKVPREPRVRAWAKRLP